jgi:tetratricopeptide (TPR) repeat protein
MVKIKCGLAPLLVAGLMIASSQPTQADVVADCKSANPALAIRACSIVIDAGGSKPINLIYAYARRANAFAAAGKKDAALTDLSKAIELSPALAGLYSNRGTVYFATGNLERALADYNEAIKLKADFAGAYFNRGNLYSRIGKLDNALADLTAAVKLDPSYASAYFNRAIVYSRMGRTKQAHADFRRTLKLNPLHRGAAQALSAMGTEF